MRLLASAVLIMFFATAPAIAAGQPKLPKPQGDPYEQWREELRAIFFDRSPHYDPRTPGVVKLAGTEVLCACEVTTRKRVELQPGVEAAGVLVVTKAKSGADVWFVNWNGWNRRLATLSGETPGDAAYAPSGNGGIVLLASPGDGTINLHALRLSFVPYLNLPGGETLRIPVIEAKRHEVVRVPAKVECVRVLHVGYEYSDGKEKPLFLLLYTVEVENKPVEEYGADLYVALVRVDPDNLSLEVVYGPAINDFQHVTVFDANVVETPEKYREHRVGDRKIVANWVIVAYAKQWKECGVYLTLLGYSPADDMYLPMASTELSDGSCSPPVGNLRLAHVTLDNGTVVFLTVWTDGRDPISYLRGMLRPLLVSPPEGEASVNGSVVWGQPAVLEMGANPRILASVKNKPVAVIPGKFKLASLIGVKGPEGSALFWLDVVDSDGIRSFPIPVVVKREGTAVYAAPSVFAVTARMKRENKFYDVLMWVFGTFDSRAGEPGLIPNVILPEDEFKDTKIWEPWASTLTFAEEGVDSAITVTIDKTLELPEIPAGDEYVIGKMLGTVYLQQKGNQKDVFVIPSVPIVYLRSPVLMGGYQPVVPLRYRMLKPTVIVSGSEEPVTQGSIVPYRIALSVDGNALTLRPGLSTVIVVKCRNEIVGAALVKLEPNGPIVRCERDLKRVEVKLDGPEVRFIDAWVNVEDTGRYTVEVFFADALGRLMEGEAVIQSTVRRQLPSQAPLPAYNRGYVPPGLGVASPGKSESRPGLTFPVPVPARVRIRGTKGRRVTG